MYINTDKFIVRTPRYPVETIKRALVDDKFFEEIIDSYEFREALYFSTPALYEQLVNRGKGVLNFEDELNVKLSLLKYLSRMSVRCTPFATFAACSVGRISNRTNIVIETSLERHFRLDMLYLCTLSQYLQCNKELLKQLHCKLNSTVYVVGKRIRYINYVYSINNKSYRIEELAASSILRFIIRKTKRRILFKDLVDLIRTEFDVSIVDVEDYLLNLLSNHILICEIEPLVLGPDYFRFLIECIKDKNCYESIEKLLQIQNHLNCLNSFKEADKILICEDLKCCIKDVGIPYNKKYLLQLDSIRHTTDAVVSNIVISQLQECLKFLNRLMPYGDSRNLMNFKKKFRDRYQEQELPLLEVLDPDIGIGADIYPSQTNAALIRDLHVPYAENKKAATTRLKNRIIQLAVIGVPEIVLDETDVADSISTEDNLPSSMLAMFQLVLDSKTGTMRLCNLKFLGCSAGNLIARFAYCDEEIASLVEQITDSEQLVSADVALAEISHIPNSRVGNILYRPVMRGYEIDYLTNGVRNSRQSIPVSDLMVSVKGDSIILRSKSLNKIIVPRLTTAHNYYKGASPLYQFLCELQHEHCRAGLYFYWDDWENKLTYFPRVRYKNVILSLAKWKFKSRELNVKKGRLSFGDFLKWKQTQKLPRFVTFVENDNKLFLDLENEYSVRTLLKAITGKEQFELEEYMDCGNAVSDAMGYTYMNECLVPLIKKYDK